LLPNKLLPPVPNVGAALDEPSPVLPPNILEVPPVFPPNILEVLLLLLPVLVLPNKDVPVLDA